MLNFPSAPSAGAEYTSGGITYTWNGELWIVNRVLAKPYAPPRVQIKRTETPDNPPGDLLPGELAVEMEDPVRLWVGVPIPLDPAGRKLLIDVSGGSTGEAPIDGSTYGRKDAAWEEVLPVSGGTMTGAIHLPIAAPTVPEEAANKKYVDDTLTTVTGGVVRADIAQAFTTQQKAQARVNIDCQLSAYDNFMINGRMNVSSERGLTAVAMSGANPFVIDIWRASAITAANVQAAQVPVAPSPVNGFTNMLRVFAVTGMGSLANGDFAYLQHNFEAQRVQPLAWGTPDARPLSYAFMFFSTIAGTPFMRFSNRTGNRLFYREFPVVAGWNFVSGTIPGDTTGTWDLGGTSSGLTLQIFGAGKDAAGPAVPDVWGATSRLQTTNSTNLLTSPANNFGITGIYMCGGYAPPSQFQLPFLMRPDGDDARLIKRYFQVWKAPSAGAYIGTLQCFGATAAVGRAWNFQVDMRAQPTMSFGPLGSDFGLLDAGTGSHAVTAVNSFSGSVDGAWINLTCVTGLTPPQATSLVFLTANGQLAADARF